MRGSALPPIYERVAFDLAKKISLGELEEQERLGGRSILAAQYGVSPETVRRAVKQLADMEIVEVQDNVGAVVLSRAKAAAYIEKYQEGSNVRSLKRELHNLIEERNRLNEQIVELMDRIIDLNGRFAKSELLSNYEFEIPPDSRLVGKTLGESAFRQHTGGTVVAVRSGKEVTLSPGRQTVFQAHDRLVVAGSPDLVERVKTYLT